jgi:LacI family transcriptional regulator
MANVLKRDDITKVTIADVARRAGVAPMTVSRYINSHPYLRPETAERVRAAIAALGYEPNYAARLLMGQPSNAIGLIMPEIADHVFAEVAHGVQDGARLKNKLVWMVASNSNVAIEEQQIRLMQRHKVDGILLIAAEARSSYLTSVLGDKKTLVAIDRPIESCATDSVQVENRSSSRMAVEHLIGHGHKNIACVADFEQLFTIRERIAGYREAMSDHGLSTDILNGARDRASTERLLLELFRRRKKVQAIFTTSNITTIFVLECLHDMNRSIPQEVALIGFDDFELASAFRPSLTVVRQPAAELGRQAAHLLFERLDADRIYPPVRITLPTELILRESCGCSNTRNVHLRRR